MGYSTVVSHFGLPVEELIEALKDTESEELIEFREWLKEQSEDSIALDVKDKLQIPNSKQTYEKFEVWEMQPTKKSTHSSTQLF